VKLNKDTAYWGFKKYREIFESAAKRRFQKFLWVLWQRKVLEKDELKIRLFFRLQNPIKMLRW